MLLGRDGNAQVSKASRQKAVEDLEGVSSASAPLICCLPPALLRGLLGRPAHCGMVSSIPGLYSRANPRYREQLSPDIAKHPPGVGGQNCPSLKAVDLEIDSEVSLSSWAAIIKSHRLRGSNSRQQTFVSQTGRWNVQDQDTAP